MHVLHQVLPFDLFLYFSVCRRINQYNNVEMQEIKLDTKLRCVAKPRHSDSALKELGDQVSTFCAGNDCTVQLTLARHMRHTHVRSRSSTITCEDTIDPRPQCHATPTFTIAFPLSHQAARV